MYLTDAFVCVCAYHRQTLCPRGKLFGLSAHPMRDEVVTVGDDGTLRIYDIISHRVVRHMLLDAPARCVAYSPDGTLIAVGLGVVETATTQVCDGNGGEGGEGRGAPNVACVTAVAVLLA